jgi:26S proteasome regulatory subunit N10
MKKTGVSVDFVAFGDLSPSNTKKLEAFNENVKSGDGSHLAIIPPGPSLISDQLVSTPILGGDGTTRAPDGASGGGHTGGGDDFDFDPNTDPELALALRMSMEEERARQEKEEKAKQAAEKAKMEGIPEENEPLLNKDGEASGSKDKDGDDKMDTA